MKIKTIKDGVLIGRFLRYIVGGWLWAGINVFFLWLFTDIIWIYYIFSAVLAFLIALIVGFFFQKYITFKDASSRHFQQLFLFFIFQWIGLLIDLFLLWLLVTQCWYYYLYVSIFNKGIIFFRNFIMNHFFTFYKNK